MSPISNQCKLQSYFWDIIEGIAYIHKMGVIHADIKPQNCLLQRIPGQLPLVKLIDFGLAHIANEKGEALMKTICGTINYIAPECENVNNYYLYYLGCNNYLCN